MRHIRLPYDLSLEEITEQLSITEVQPFCFSAIKKDTYLSINISEDTENPYSIKDIFTLEGRYLNPPLDLYIRKYDPLFQSLVARAYPRYRRLIPKDDMYQILCLTVINLYNKNYYLHKHLINKSFINALNEECLKLKEHIPIDELDDNGMTVLDTLVDEDETQKMRDLTYYTQEDYNKILFEKVKARMLLEMSEFEFNRILVQLKSNTISSKTSYLLRRLREEYEHETF